MSTPVATRRGFRRRSRTVLAKSNSNTPVGSISGIEANQNTTLEASAAMLTAGAFAPCETHPPHPHRECNAGLDESEY